ncbi:MAG: hypothetical protein IPJ34_09030 [Myxococcales bacterium]|nr:hypothetical protein [Myxococcales bacterium]
MEPRRFPAVTLLGGHRVATLISLGLTLLCLVGGMTLVAKAGLPAGKDGGAFLRVMFYAILGGLGSSWWFSRVVRKPTDRVGELVVADDALSLAGEPLVRRAEIRAAHVLPEPTGATVRLARGAIAGPIDLAVGSVEQGRALVQALGLDASKTSTAVAIYARTTEELAERRRKGVIATLSLLASVAALFPLIKLGYSLGALIAGLAVAASYATILAMRFKSARAEVGADGVVLSWLGRRQFVPIREIERAEVVEGKATLVRIHRIGAPPLDVVAAVRNAPTLGERPAQLLAERIEEAVQARGLGGAAVAVDDPEGVLVRGARPIAEWIAELRGLRDRVPTFRAPGLFDRLWDVLEDVRATPTQRAAAAVALTPHLDEEGKTRLQVAAQAAVAPKLRIALEAAAEQDDARLAEALEEAGEEAATRGV